MLVFLLYHTLRKKSIPHRKWFNPNTQRGPVVPHWGRRDLRLGTIHAAVRQLGTNWQDFQDA